MKPILKKVTLGLWLLSSSFIVQSSMAETNDVTGAAIVKPSNQRVQVALPANYNAKMLANSKIVYEQLKLARTAALNKNKTAVLKALGDVVNSLRKIELPPSLVSLDKQLGIIQLAINNPSKKVHPSFWTSLEKDLKKMLIFAPKKQKDAAITSLKKGYQSSFSNNNKTAQSALNEVINASSYNLGTFPISKVNQDIYSALSSIRSDYWPGAVEAIQSALATFHWYDQIPSYKLLSAYTDVVNAYTLASAPEFRPIQDQIIRNQLSDAQDKLKKVPGCDDLVQQIEMLITEIDPFGREIKKVLQHIQLKINEQRKNSENKLLQKK